jgi:hypothetical protein
MADKGKRPLLVWIVEAFSLLTALAFVLSGICNAYLFATVWNLNYFLIASPADVVMTGFVFVPITAAAVLAVSLLYAVMLLVSKYLERRSPPGFPIPDIELPKADLWMIFRGGVAPASYMRWAAIGLQVGIAAFLAAHIFSMVATTRVGGGVRTGGNRPPVSTGGTTNPPPSAGTSNPRDDSGQIFSYATGLRLTPQSPDPECAGGSILWMGSDHLIASCRFGIKVIQKTEGFSAEPLSVRRPGA